MTASDRRNAWVLSSWLISAIVHLSVAILTALICIFIAGSVIAKAHGLDINCGCFGHVSQNLSFTWHLALDFAILAALLALWLSQRPSRASAL